MDWHGFLQHRPQAYLGRGAPDRRVLALTFDDGPGAATPDLLDALAELDVRASFFCVGAAMRARPALVRRLLDEGHELGNHSERHADARGIEAGRWMREEVAPAAQALAAACGSTLQAAPAPLFRPAYGEIDAAQYEALAAAGYTVVGWSVDPRDWLEPDAPGYVPCVVESVLARIHPGAIVLLHDGDDESGRARGGIVEIVRRLVPALRGQGYGLVRAGDLLAERPPTDPERASAAN
ncbi:polysaccharide deacetylase family protein [Lysobacter sp. BMK333-48F3]|uniref:polysaccharide deacetylase family protein n=1 Tax=Lysobacter sp. BMK333-48F3 TaxID=2867962 RepID=UPI001C8C98B6|nr:polysaccharide deacetylase family protein [Lysobacter sp. BMK333-48F3]MBX9402614.1 polysaccharide deacetylase family protein [Lysobacter sp. BMK333-48F3]